MANPALVDARGGSLRHEKILVVPAHAGTHSRGACGYGRWCSGCDKLRRAVFMGPGLRRDDGGGLFHRCGLELSADGTVFPECTGARSPDERSEIRRFAFPAYRYAHAGYLLT